MPDVKIIAEHRLDAFMQGVLLRPDSLARKVIQSMISISGGGGGGGWTSYGGSPIEITDIDEGTARLDIVGAGATLTDSADGTYVTLTVGGTA